MKTYKPFILLILLFFLFITGCVPGDLHRTSVYGDTQLKDLSLADAQAMFIKNTTTTEEVAAKLGNPSTTTASASGVESWIYTYTESNAAQISGDGLFGGTSYTADVNVKMLTITFKNGILSDFYFNQSSSTPGTTTYELK